MIFKFLVKCIFFSSKSRKKSESKEISIVKVFFSRVYLFVTICTKTALKIALKKLFFQKNWFFKFLSPELCIKIKVLQNTAQPKSMSMQMISGKIHFDTIALRQNNAIWKWTVITFVQCKPQSYTELRTTSGPPP